MLKQPFESDVLFVPYSTTLALATGRPSEFKTAPTIDVAGWQGTNAQQPVRAMHMAAGKKSEKSDRIFYDAQRGNNRTTRPAAQVRLIAGLDVIKRTSLGGANQKGLLFQAQVANVSIGHQSRELRESDQKIHWRSQVSARGQRLKKSLFFDGRSQSIFPPPQSRMRPRSNRRRALEIPLALRISWWAPVA